MGEVIILYTKDEPDRPIECDRGDFYAGENRYNKYRDQHAAIVDVFLFNRRGEVLLQKRSRNKQNSPGKLHTSVGDHINVGEEASFAVIHECMEELGVAALSFPKEKFDQAYAKLGDYANRAALLCELGGRYLDYPTRPPHQGNIQDRIWFYLGRYDGPVENIDHSCAGFEWMSLETFAKELAANPEQFTYPIRVYMEQLGDEISEFLKKYCSL